MTDLPWIHSKIKSLIKNKTEYFKNCVKPNNPESMGNFEQIISNFLENL